MRSQTILQQKEMSIPRIVSVKLKVEADYDYPFEDMIGSFSREPKSKYAINHRRRQGHHDELEWFNPAWAENRADAERAYCEIMPFLRDRNWMLRISASAEVIVPCGASSVTAKVGACWADGFDDEDSAGREEALTQVKEELTGELRQLGFTDEAIASAIDGAETEDN